MMEHHFLPLTSARAAATPAYVSLTFWCEEDVHHQREPIRLGQNTISIGNFAAPRRIASILRYHPPAPANDVQLR
jgi:hypothetical protein